MVFSCVGAYCNPRHVLCGCSSINFSRETELCLSVTDAVFPCALLLFLSFIVCCEILFVF